ncbi:hemerythrin HHE cation-binding protein [Mangrovimicrobium sediminis]|uniref:Hemerythrin HHE cation-binding protein n=1 Tax=Mangrovimicrobium sediminis TaxID=2562682 RepID=A0A4Z0M702_9GAMM|nr:hemerythrin family protein [Haliea sp. SAOS-164]TGD75095.1 hemerythrin HHE cation-binding protein [Haliea sp. SAOS-164]
MPSDTPAQAHSESATHSDALDDAGLALGYPQMDDTHREFLALAQLAAQAPGAALAPALHELFEHTQAHFLSEESRMEAVNHKLLGEHRAEHQRILGDMQRFCDRAEAGRGGMARAWVSDNLMEWFGNHARTMDSALAADLCLRAAGEEDAAD